MFFSGWQAAYVAMGQTTSEGTEKAEFGALQAPTAGDALQQVEGMLSRRAWQDAEQLCHRVLTSDPGSADATYLLGYALFREGRAIESLKVYTDAARLRKPGAQDLMVVAADYVVLADYKDADRWFTKVTEWQPDYALAWYYRGRTEYKREQYSDALGAFQKASVLDPDNVRIKDNLGLAYQMLGDTTQAKAAFVQAIKIESEKPSNYSLPFLNLGALLIQLGDQEQALIYLKKAVLLAPANPRARAELGTVYEKSGQRSAAERELEAAVSLAPNAYSLHFMLGRIYRNNGKADLAAKEFDKTKSLYAQNPSAEIPDEIENAPK